MPLATGSILEHRSPKCSAKCAIYDTLAPYAFPTGTHFRVQIDTTESMVTHCDLVCYAAVLVMIVLGPHTASTCAGMCNYYYSGYYYY